MWYCYHDIVIIIIQLSNEEQVELCQVLALKCFNLNLCVHFNLIHITHCVHVLYILK